MNPTLYKAFIEIGYKGFDKVGQYMTKAVSDVQKGLNNLNGAMSGWQQSMASFAQSGSPLAFNTLGASVELLKTRIGTAFTPVLLMASKSIQQLADWVKSLDPETRKMIATWTTLGVVGVGLAATLGNLVASFVKLAWAASTWVISNPFVLGLAAISAAAGYAWLKLTQLENQMAKIAETSKRIDSGNINQEDINSSYVGKKLMAVNDPEKRTKQAERNLEILEKRKKQLMGEVGDMGMGNDTLNQIGTGADVLGLFGKSLVGAQKDEYEQLTRDIAITKQFISTGKKGAKPTIAATPKADDGFSLSGMRGMMGAKAGTGSLDSAYSGLNNMALGQDDIQRRILKEQQEANKAAQENAKSTVSIQEWLMGVGKG